MARPKRTEVDELRSKSTMWFIIYSEFLSSNGNALEKFFEPESIKQSEKSGRFYRSNKWYRYFNNGVRPIGSALNLIRDMTPGAYAHYESPFWNAISVGERSDSKWTEFYLTLDAEVQKRVFLFLSDPDYSMYRTKRKRRPLEQLIRIGNDHAIAALIPPVSG